MATRPDDARTNFLVALRRARGTTAGRLPVAIVLAEAAGFAACALGGWSFSGTSGCWTDGPLAQLLIVPAEPPQGDALVEFEIADALVNPRHRTQAVNADVNGAASARWTFAHDQPWEPRRRIVVPGGAVERLSGFLISLRIETPLPLRTLGMKNDLRALGIALRGVGVRSLR